MSIALSAQLKLDLSKQLSPEHEEDWRALDVYTESIYHQIYRCHVYTWLAMGWSKNKQKQRTRQYHLYVEFRAVCGSSQYQTLVFRELEKALAFQQKKVAVMPLSGISPKQTAKRPIKPIAGIPQPVVS